MTEETVTIPKNKYLELLEDQEKLRRLEVGGVDNWEWYSACFEDDD